jgi:hypothetical protein
MCQITAPPTVFLAGPLQQPGWWLLVVGLLAFGMWAELYIYRKRLRQQQSALYRRVGVTLLTGAIPLACMSVVLLLLVVMPSREALSAWVESQHDSLTASHCADTAYAALGATFYRQRNGPVATLQLVAFVFVVVGLGAEFIWIYWINRRPRAQPGGQ